MTIARKVRKSDPLAVGPSGNLEYAMGTFIAGASFFIAVFFLAREVFSWLYPVSGQEPLSLLPAVVLFLLFGTVGLVMRLRQTSTVYADGWAPPRKTFRRPHNHRSFLKWQEIDGMELGPGVSRILDWIRYTIAGEFQIPLGPPGRLKVLLRTGESFKVKLSEVGPVIYQELAHRFPTTVATT